jgi:hypothetical protein
MRKYPVNGPIYHAIVLAVPANEACNPFIRRAEMDSSDELLRTTFL